MALSAYALHAMLTSIIHVVHTQCTEVVAGSAEDLQALAMVMLILEDWLHDVPDVAVTVARDHGCTALQAKLELEAQMRENARRRREAPMSDIEKTVNGPLLRKVDAYEATQRLALKPFPAEFLPSELQSTQSKLNEHHARARLKSARGLLTPPGALKSAS